MDNMYDNLTDSAKNALSTLIKEYETKMLNEASSIADSKRKITLDDLLIAQKRLSNMYNEADLELEMMNLQIMKSVSHSLQMGQLFGIVLVLIIVSFIVIIIKPTLNSAFNQSIFPLIASIISIFLAVYVTYISKRIAENRRKRVYQNIQSVTLDNIILKAWSRIEDLGSSLMDYDKSFKTIHPEIDVIEPSITDLIAFLSQLLEESGDESFLRDILNVRNRILHDDSNDITDEEKEFTIKKANHIIDNLETKLYRESSSDSSN